MCPLARRESVAAKILSETEKAERYLDGRELLVNAQSSQSCCNALFIRVHRAYTSIAVALMTHCREASRS